MSPGAAVIKHYQIVSCLGQGGFGKVFEAWDSKLQRSVAIKRLNADGILSPATDLLREARMAASLNHPAFVKIHALEDDDDSLAIVMELIKGETLKQVITHHQPDFTRAIHIIRQIAEAMQQAHEFGLTHGDLKPSNIMLEPSGIIRILDFGLASKADQEATTSMLQQDPQGTIAYMAPERLLGAPLASQSDIYALGVIFYELLNGQRPFAELNGLALAAALVQSSSDQWNYSRALSPSIIYLVRRMTAKQPAQRLSSMAEFLTALDNVELHIPVSIPDELDKRIPANENIEHSQQLTRKQLRRKHFKNAVLLSVLIISCVVLGGWLARNHLWRFEEVIPRYSESQEMKLGMGALEQWDRPGSLDAAIKHFNNLAEQNPENAAAIAGLSIAYSLLYSSDKNDEIWLKKATASAQQSMELDSNLSIVHVALGRAFYAQGKNSDALSYFESAIALDPNNAFALSGKIDALYDLNRVEEALLLTKSCLLTFPKNRVCADKIGVIYMDQSNYTEAENAFRKSIQIQRDSIYAYVNLSGVLLYQDKLTEALQVLQQGLQIRKSAWLYSNMGNVYFLMGDYVKAASAFEAAIAPELGNSGDYMGWANLADTLLWIPGRKSEAAKYYRRSRELLSPVFKGKPENMLLASRMALYSARLGDTNYARTLLSQILNGGAVSVDINFRAGLTYELIGDRKSALSQLTAAHNLGYPISIIESTPELEALRRDPDYKLY